MIYENARVVIGLCRWYIVVAEMIAAEHWIGYMIWQAHKYANIPKIYVALITLWSLWLLIDNIMRHYKNNLFPYLEPNG
jgi:NitT/TauT family transport system permease protein